MWKYILKRILIFIPTIIAISLITFTLNIYSKGDPVEEMLNSSSSDGQMADKLSSEKDYINQWKELKLNLPVFYFSLSSLSEPDTLYKIPKKKQRKNLSELVSQYGNWEDISKYYESLKELEIKAYNLQKDSVNANVIIAIKQDAEVLYEQSDDEKINSFLNRIEKNALSNDYTQAIIPQLNTVKHNYESMKINESNWKNYVPKIIFYGLDNQYHHWITSFLTGDFGKSYNTRLPISESIKDRIGWTMLFSFLSILLSYLIAIPLGVNSARKKGKLYDNTVSTGLFILYSLPSFWVATLLIVYVAGELKWFPTYGLGSVPDDASFWESMSIRIKHMVLPLICWTYGSLAYLSRQMRGGMINVLKMDFVRTAKAKGLPENTVIWKHAFRNSLLPIITIFANVFPLMIGGSVVIEVLFSIPGLGKYGFDAIILKDYPVILSVMMLSAILTMIGYLVADILYVFTDPRITYDKK